MQEKSCNNCYFSIPESHKSHPVHCYYHDYSPPKLFCHSHTFGCEECNNGELYSEIATFIYNGKRYCEDCLSSIIGIEKRPITVTQYYDLHGNYIGNSDDTELEDILLNFSGCEYIEN